MLKKHLPPVNITETDSLRLSISEAERLQGRGVIKKEVPGGLPEWNQPRKFSINAGNIW